MIWNKNGFLSLWCLDDFFYYVLLSFGNMEVLGVLWEVMDMNEDCWFMWLVMGWFVYMTVRLSWQEVEFLVLLWLLKRIRGSRWKGVRWSGKNVKKYLCSVILWRLCYRRGYQEVYLVYQMIYEIHLMIILQLIDYVGIIYVNYTCIFFKWKMRSIWHVMEYGISSISFIYQWVNGFVMGMGVLCYLPEHLIANWKKLKRFYEYNGLVGRKRIVY